MNLYRRSSFWARVALVLVCIAGFTVAAAQRRKPHKLRATALVEFAGDASGVMTPRIIPIAILDEGSFHDASIYKATPRPMALDDGVVYEAQKTGQPVGYVTLGRAVKRDDMWMASGRWQPVDSAPKASASHAAAANPADERPILRRPGNAPDTSTPASASASPTPSPTPSSTPSDGRPVLQRPAGDTSAQGTPTPAAPNTPSGESTPELAPDDPDRPTLRHRTPQTAREREDAITPKQAAPLSPPNGTSAVPKIPALPSAGTGAPGMVAISDSQPSDTRSYEFVWKPGEQEKMEAKMRRLALAQLPREGPPLTEKSLANVAIRSFDLDLSNDAVMVLTAEIPPSAVAATGASQAGAKGAAKGSRTSASFAPTKPVSRYITLIARVDIDGNPQKLSASVTDSSRLDVAPRLELIDAVDVDGDGLAELLFREYDFDQKSFVIYGVGRGGVTKVFEGASQPLK